MYNADSFHEWEEPISEGLKSFFIRMLKSRGNYEDAYMVEEECGANKYPMWQFRSLYEIMHSTIGPDNLNEWLMVFGIYGIVAENAMLPGKIYVAFNPEDLTIIDNE
jgi:hypothetical protein